MTQTSDTSPAAPEPAHVPAVRSVRAITRTADSFQNFCARTGMGTQNLAAAGRYGFNPVTRNRLQMEWCYRGSWVAGIVVDAPAEDMTREGVEINSGDKPSELEALSKEAQRLQFWSKLGEALKWGRLYGGALGYLMVDGQDPKSPLRLDTVTKGQFRGILPLDRWMVQPSLSDLVSELGPDVGNPKYYDLLPDTGTGIGRTTIHYSRVIRIEGVRLPYWQRISENLWGQSVIERLWDRMVAFDSSTQGAAQMVYKAHLRTYAVDGLRDIIAAGGKALDGLVAQIAMIRMYQSNEGMTLMDTKDKFETHQYQFGGLADIIGAFGEQLSGAAEIPLVRLFGQSPAGLSATGESDLRNYYDGLKHKQETNLRPGVEPAYELLYRSTLGRAPPAAYGLKFKPLWQMNDEQKARITSERAQAVVSTYEAQIIGLATALKELRALAEVTGAFSNITDEEIKRAEANPGASPGELGIDLQAILKEFKNRRSQASGQEPNENRPGGTGLPETT